MTQQALLDLFSLLQTEHPSWRTSEELLALWEEALGTVTPNELIATGKAYLKREVGRPQLAKFIKLLDERRLERNETEARQGRSGPEMHRDNCYRDLATPFAAARGMLVFGYPHESMNREGFELRLGADGFKELCLAPGYEWVPSRNGGMVVVRTLDD